MHMLYDSDSFAVLQVVVPATGGLSVLSREGFEIMDKFAQREVYLEGALAQSFEDGVQALMQTEPSQDEMDDFLGQFTAWAHQPLVLH